MNMAAPPDGGRQRSPWRAASWAMALIATSGCGKSATPAPELAAAPAATAAATSVAKEAAPAPPAPPAVAPAAAASATAAPDAGAAALPPAVEAALASVKSKLREELMTAMKAGGPVAAVQACQIKAPGIAAEAALPGLRVGRTAARLRNPANAAPPWATAAVAAAEGKRLDKVAPRQHFDLGGGKHGYLEVIATAPVCVSCHGASDTFAPALAAKINALYPDDKARGFAEGDVRGFFWAEYALPAAAAPAPGAAAGP